jgi:hypothetical protein
VALSQSEFHHCSVAAAYVAGHGLLRLSDTLLADSPVGVFVESDGSLKVEAIRYERVDRHQVDAK